MCCCSKAREFQFKTLLKQTETRNGNRYDLLVFTIKTILFCFYAGTREHVVDIINTFILLKPLLLTVLEVAKKKLSKPQT